MCWVWVMGGCFGGEDPGRVLQSVGREATQEVKDSSRTAAAAEALSPCSNSPGGHARLDLLKLLTQLVQLKGIHLVGMSRLDEREEGGLWRQSG